MSATSFEPDPFPLEPLQLESSNPASEQVVKALQAALRQNDAHNCRWLAGQAGRFQNGAAIPLLRDLLLIPAKGPRRRWKNSRSWIWARVAAVEALGRIGDPAALPALVNALFDPSPLVREAAAFILPAFGNRALPPLIRALRTKKDWPLQSIKLLINILGALRNKRATPALLQVLSEQLPGAPARWTSQTFLTPLILMLIGGAGWWLSFFLTNPVDSPSGLLGYLQLLIYIIATTITPLLFFYMVLVCVFFVPIMSITAARERDTLALTSLDALVALQDQRAVPAIADIAFGSRPHLRHSARKALQSLLPLLTEEDRNRLRGRTQTQLLKALAKSEPEMVVAILRSLHQVGTGQAVEEVESLVRNGVTVDIRREAARVLPVLRERQQQELAAVSLLRASASPATVSGELLRAATDKDHTPPDELLRPS